MIKMSFGLVSSCHAAGFFCRAGVFMSPGIDESNKKCYKKFGLEKFIFQPGSFNRISIGCLFYKLVILPVPTIKTGLSSSESSDCNFSTLWRTLLLISGFFNISGIRFNKVLAGNSI